MKILCISNYYPPFFEGGYEISVQETMAYLSERGHQIYVLCGNKGVDSPDPIPSSLTPIEPLRTLRYIDYARPCFMDKHRVEKYNYNTVLQIALQVRPDIVYFGNMKALSISPVLAIQKLQIPRVFDLGDIWLKSYQNSSLKGRMFRLAKRVLPFTIGGRIDLNPVIVLSNWMRDEVRQNYASTEVYIVPRGINIPKTAPKSTNLPLRYVYVGRVEPNKGLDLCIRAIGILNLEKPEHAYTMDVYGEADPAYEAICIAMIESNNLRHQIRFKGKSTKIMHVLESYDVLLMPTMAQEAFGRIIIEAMASRLIVIATNAYGPKEIIDDGTDGFLFERGSVSALVTTIKHVSALSSEERKRICDNARQKVVDKYEITLVKKQIEIILESIVNKIDNTKSEV